MDFKLTSMSAVLERADGRLRSPEGGARLWPTGFPLLDEAIGGGFRAGSLNLLGGPQGQGKTFFALQAAPASSTRSTRPRSTRSEASSKAATAVRVA
jgi:replicative DNA helicase